MTGVADSPAPANRYRRRLGRRELLLATPAALLALIGIVWALSQPLSSAPDEPEHIVRAVSLYSGSGIKVPLKVVGQTFTGRVRAPEYFVRGLPSQHCVVSDASRPASCHSKGVADPGRIVKGYTSAAGHPPVYYLLVGWIGRLAPSAFGVMLMRIWSVLLCATAVLVATTVLARRAGTMEPAIAALTAFSPVAAFLAGSVNPQTFEICLTITAFALTWDLFSDLTARGDGPGPPLIRYAAPLATSLALGLTRPLSAAFLLAAVVVGVVLSRIPWRSLLRPAALLGLAVSLVGVPAAIAFEILAGHSSVSLVPADVPSTYSGIQRLLDTVGTMVIQAGGVVSSLEAGASSLAVGGFVVATLTMLLVAALVGERRATLVAWAVVAGALALPVVANIPNVVELKIVIWQGRYGLPLVGIALAAAAIALLPPGTTVDHRLRRRTLSIVCWSMAIAHLGGWWFAMYRWAVGIGGPMWWPSRAGWHPPLPWWLLGAGMVVACAGYALVLPAIGQVMPSSGRRKSPV